VCCLVYQYILFVVSYIHVNGGITNFLVFSIKMVVWPETFCRIIKYSRDFCVLSWLCRVYLKCFEFLTLKL